MWTGGTSFRFYRPHTSLGRHQICMMQTASNLERIIFRRYQLPFITSKVGDVAVVASIHLFSHSRIHVLLFTSHLIRDAVRSKCLYNYHQGEHMVVLLALLHLFSCTISALCIMGFRGMDGVSFWRSLTISDFPTLPIDLCARRISFCRVSSSCISKHQHQVSYSAIPLHAFLLCSFNGVGSLLIFSCILLFVVQIFCGSGICWLL